MNRLLSPGKKLLLGLTFDFVDCYFKVLSQSIWVNSHEFLFNG